MFGNIGHVYPVRLIAKGHGMTISRLSRHHLAWFAWAACSLAAGMPVQAQLTPLDTHPSHGGHALADQPLPTSGQVTGVVLTEANVWQGTWPADNRLTHGCFYTSPVGRFTPDGIGTLNMIASVWGWVSDWCDGGTPAKLPSRNPHNRAGGKQVALEGHPLRHTWLIKDTIKSE